MKGALARFTKKSSREITTAVALVLVILIFSLLNMPDTWNMIT